MNPVFRREFGRLLVCRFGGEKVRQSSIRRPTTSWVTAPTAPAFMVPAIKRTPDHNETAEDEMESLEFQAIKDEKAG